MNLPFTASNLVTRRVQDEIADLKYGWTRCGTTARDRTQASEENFKREWFGQIVVSADIKTLDDIGHRISRCQHQDRGVVVISSESAGYLETVDHGQHEIKHYDVELCCGCQLQSAAPVEGQTNAMVIRLKAFLEDGCHLLLVFHNQDPHKRFVPDLSASLSTISRLKPHRRPYGPQAFRSPPALAYTRGEFRDLSRGCVRRAEP